MKGKDNGAALQHSSITALSQIVRSTTRDAALFDDLLQEALVHAWVMETRRPGQTRSWYLQSCKFHLLHYLGSGRSVDSPKRGSSHLQLDADPAVGDWEIEVANPAGSELSLVYARDLLGLLSRYLPPRDTTILYCLADGMGPREIGRKLNLSHASVIKRRRKIAALLTRLEPPFRADQPARRTDFARGRSPNGKPSGGFRSFARTGVKAPNGCSAAYPRNGCQNRENICQIQRSASVPACDQC